MHFHWKSARGAISSAHTHYTLRGFKGRESVFAQAHVDEAERFKASSAADICCKMDNRDQDHELQRKVTSYEGWQVPQVDHDLDRISCAHMLGPSS
ncbi:hypothetical protein KQX54_002447 [Cotesia glomerata]|uniref:Uncharacterized protein n=1 Tax=Cotesia glomerata TaxID=32391 RepID=A0AAV7I1T9_COTGL|nr:hypothetical protein KQX54_002447 [Cotesia glomerata]